MKIKLFLNFIHILFNNLKELKSNLYKFTMETSSKNYVQKKYKLNKGVPVIDILDIFPNFSNTIKNYTFLNGASRITDIALIKAITEQFEDARFLEIGTLRGETISNIATVAKDCVSLSLSDQEMKDIGVDEYSRKVTRMFSEGIQNINHIEHNSQTFDFKEMEKSFDVIFIDGDHSPKGVEIDTRNAFKLLKNENSIIIWHDYGRGFESVNWQVLSGIMDGCPSDEVRNKIRRVSNTLCAIYTNKEYPANYPTPRTPLSKFEISFKATPTTVNPN